MIERRPLVPRTAHPGISCTCMKLSVVSMPSPRASSGLAAASRTAPPEMLPNDNFDSRTEALSVPSVARNVR
jgi:hypothetical protein